MYSAFDAATSKFNPKVASKDTSKMGELVAGIAAQSLANAEANRKEVLSRLESYERSIRDTNRTLRLRDEEVHQLKAAYNPSHIKGTITRKVKASVAFSESMIDDIQFVGPDLFVTTADLSFAETKIESHRDEILLSGQNIGRFLIMIRPSFYANHGSISAAIQILNLTWRVANGGGNYCYHHPFIKEGGYVCFGDTQSDFQKYFKTCDLVGVIDLALALLVTPNDGNAWIGWGQYFDERRPLVQSLREGESFWQFGDGPRSIERFTADPKKKKLWAKVMRDLAGSGWVGMIDSSITMSPRDANRRLWDETNNLYTVLNEDPTGQKYKDYLKHLEQQVPRQAPLIVDDIGSMPDLQIHEPVNGAEYERAYERMVEQQMNPTQQMAQYVNQARQTTTSAASTTNLTATNISRLIDTRLNGDTEEHPF